MPFVRWCRRCGLQLATTRPHPIARCDDAIVARDLRREGWYPTPRVHLHAFRLSGLAVKVAGRHWSPLPAIDMADEKGPEAAARAYPNFPLPSSAIRAIEKITRG